MIKSPLIRTTPLAGVVLNFDIKVVGVRVATKEDLEHAHSHDGEHSR
ncbi:MAG: hypothetical protein KC592_14495 [Nitrospira sp.]|nr:hypothetical protein [Nitrospira sp.]